MSTTVKCPTCGAEVALLVSPNRPVIRIRYHEAKGGVCAGSYTVVGEVKTKARTA